MKFPQTTFLLPGCILILACAGTARAVPLEIASEGKALLPVTVSENAAPEITSLADELASGLGRISTAPFVVKKGTEVSGIVVGTADEWPGFLPAVAQGVSPLLAREDYLLRSEAGRLLVIGRTPLAVQNAVWDLLYRIGFRQYFPGEKWALWPALAQLTVDLNTVESPDYFTRRLRVGGVTWADNRDAVAQWKRRNRMVSGFTLSSGHAYGRIASTLAAEFAQNPGTLTGSEREPKLDASHPAMPKLIRQYVAEELGKADAPDSISMEPSDGGGWRKDSPLGTPSDQATTLANYAASALRESHSGRKVGMYAYNEHSPPPSIEVDPDVIVGVATSFIKGGYTVEQLMKGWNEKGATLGVREYWGVAAWDFALPGRARASDLDYIFRTIPRFYQLGARYWDGEVTDSWGAHGLGFFLTSRLLWDVGEVDKREELQREFFSRSFGSSAGTMRKFFETCLLKSARPLLSKDLLGRMYRQLDAALKESPSPEVTARIEDFVVYTRYVEMMFEYQNLSGPAKRKAFDRMLSWVEGNHGSFMFDQWVLSREIPGRTFHIPKKDLTAWLKPAKDAAKIATPDGLRKILAKGIENNPTVPFSAVSFSEDLVPGSPSQEEIRAVKPVNLRGTNRIFLYSDNPSPEFEFILQAGLLYPDRGPVQLKLFSSANAIVDEPVATAQVEPDKMPRKVNLRSPYPGLHYLEISDGSGGTQVQWPKGQRAALMSSPQESAGMYVPTDLSFAVPAATRLVGGFSEAPAGRLLNEKGETVFDFETMGGPGYFSVEVSSEHANSVWRIQGAKGKKLLLTVPPYLSRSADELLVPREVKMEKGL